MDKKTGIKSQAKTDLAKAMEKGSLKRPSSGAVADFLKKAAEIKPGAGGQGRIILALDATMSRQPTWDLAARIQGEMFESAGNIGGLAMQLVYFRGFGESRASKWARNGRELADMMAKIDCRAGQTQIAKVLKHAQKEHGKMPVNAVVYIGDAMEEEIDLLGQLAGELGLRRVPVFVFQEGHDATTERAFKEIARLSNGGWFRFDRSSAGVLAKLLASIAVYATGGLKALTSRNTREDRLLIEQMDKHAGRGGGKR